MAFFIFLQNKIDIRYHLCYSNTTNFNTLKRNALKWIGKATSKKEMRKVEEKGYGDEIIDAGDIFCNYGIGWHLCKKACDKCRRLCVRWEIGRPVAYGICVWYVILLSGCICRICRSVWMEIRSCVDMDRNRKCDHRKSAGMGGTWKTYQGNDTASEFQDDAGFLW